MSRASSSRHIGRAGASSDARFREERIKNLKSGWKGWLVIAMFAPASVLFMVLWGKLGLAVGGWILGFVTAIGLFGWMVGFDVHSLTYRWGAWGEEYTRDELARLGPDWFVRHDIPNPYANWDHVVVGPPGIFMIDSKRLSNPRIKVEADGLASGSIRLRGTTFRGRALGLKKALTARVGSIPDVEAVVAIWGNFDGEPQERDRVVYLNASSLIEWLESRPPAISPEQRALITSALERL